MKRGISLVALAVLCGLTAGPAFSAPSETAPPSVLALRTLTALPLDGPPPVIDGKLDEAVWGRAPVATDFIQSSPHPAASASLPSEARVLVDGEALYIGLTYGDPEPRRIVAPLVRRDDETVSDWAFVEIDSRHNRRNAFSFGVNPRGVQVDGLWLSDTDYDSSWNGVWQSAAAIGPHGWTAELRIPFSQLAFALPPGRDRLVFGINFYRYSPGHGESSNWSPRYAGLGGVVSHFNDLELPAPRHVQRLEITPYSALRQGGENEGHRATEGRIGADLKADLGDSFSLTATVLPDFGQVEADPSQVNLSAFELFQTEQRPFFLEGLDVFRFDTRLAFSSRGVSFANDSPFYSRRIGRSPRGDLPDGVTVESLPTATRLLAAAKLSGETAGGWTVGGFSALGDGESASLRNANGALLRWPIEARSLTSVGRAFKTFGGGDTTLGFFGAELHRSGLGPILAPQVPADAVNAGFEARQRFDHGAYELRGWALGSQISGDPAAIQRIAESPRHLFQRPDGDQFRTGGYGDRLSGFAAETQLGKKSGSFRFDVVARAISPGFDLDETGFQQSSDWLLLAGDWRFERFPAAGRLRGWAVGSENLGLGWTFAGEPRARVVSGFLSLDGRTYWNLKLTATHELEALSVDWLRGGPALLLPPRDALALFAATDQRKPTYATLDASVAREAGSGSASFAVSPLWNVRFSDRLQMAAGPSYSRETIGWQPVARVQEGIATRDLVSRVVQRTLALTLRGDLVFSPHFSVQIYAQPFATLGRYDRYQLLRDPRAGNPAQRFAPLVPATISASPATGILGLDLDGDGAIETRLPLPDGERRELNASAVLRWEYRPGSFLTAVWNQQRQAFSFATDGSARGALGRVSGDDATDVFLIKLSRRFGR